MQFASRRFFLSGLAALGFSLGAGMATTAQAGSFTFTTPTSSTVNNLAVNAEADFTVTNGQISIVLQNFQADPTSVAQCLSGLVFTVKNASDLTGATLSSSSGNNVTVNDDTHHTYTLGQTNVTTGWAFSAATGNLTVLGTQTAPSHLIIGGPDGSGYYTSANSSILNHTQGQGNHHDPFLYKSATFVITGANITANTVITGVTFGFNSETGCTVTGTGGSNIIESVVPEPSSVVLGLVGFGLAGAVSIVRRRRAA